jgi:uncharacterized protein
VLEVTFYRDGRRRLAGLSARGHADFAEHGADVVCAAAAAILQAARLGLTECAHADVQARQAPGLLDLRWPQAERDGESLRAIVGTAELAIAQIARQYPDHVRVKRRTRTESANRRAATGKKAARPKEK